MDLLAFFITAVLGISFGALIFRSRWFQGLLDNMRKNSKVFSLKGAIEDIYEENQTIVQRLDRLEIQIEEIHKFVNELHQAIKKMTVVIKHSAVEQIHSVDI